MAQAKKCSAGLLGDQLWQKKYSTDVLPFKKMRNKGEKPKYFAENCGPAIISKQDFQLV